jgi:1-acyl-sn-glycerol-3-phosphate acyltransferase
MDLLVSFTQCTLRILLQGAGYFFRARYIHKLDAADFRKGAILAANHQSRLDFLLIYLGIPFRRFIRMLPIYELTADKYMDTWWKKLFLTAGGCIPINTLSKKAAIVGLLKLLEQVEKGNTVLIFPEGKIVKGRPPGPYGGIGYLLQKKSTVVLPVFVAGFTDVTPLSFFRRHHAAVIIYRSPFVANSRRSRDTTGQIMKSIYAL